MSTKISSIIVKEIKEALPPFIFFLFLFHMIELTKAVLLEDYTLTALRAASATLGALIVAKAILVVEALSIAQLTLNRKMFQLLWKTLLYGLVALLFRFIEELFHIANKYDSLTTATKIVFQEISWPLFIVFSLWIFGGLFLYCLAAELIQAMGRDKVNEIFFNSKHS